MVGKPELLGQRIRSRFQIMSGRTTSSCDEIPEDFCRSYGVIRPVVAVGSLLFVTHIPRESSQTPGNSTGKRIIAGGRSKSVSVLRRAERPAPKLHTGPALEVVCPQLRYLQLRSSKSKIPSPYG